MSGWKRSSFCGENSPCCAEARWAQSLPCGDATPACAQARWVSSSARRAADALCAQACEQGDGAVKFRSSIPEKAGNITLFTATRFNAMLAGIKGGTPLERQMDDSGALVVLVTGDKTPNIVVTLTAKEADIFERGVYMGDFDLKKLKAAA